MADSYSLIDGQVVPYSGGRMSHDTDSWRDATELELEQAAKIEALEQKLASMDFDDYEQTSNENDRLRAKIEALEGELKNTQDAMDAYARAFFRLSDAAEKCKETANEAQFRSLKEYYFAALQEIESVLDAALDIS